MKKNILKTQILILSLVASISLGGTEVAPELRDKSPQEVVKLMGRNPLLSFVVKDELKPILTWVFYPQDCTKCGEWVSLHPNDKKNDLIWVHRDDCTHREIKKGDRTYYSIQVEFYAFEGKWLSFKAEHHYRK